MVATVTTFAFPTRTSACYFWGEVMLETGKKGIVMSCLMEAPEVSRRACGDYEL
jgi:hypothetical protein